MQYKEKNMSKKLSGFGVGHSKDQSHYMFEMGRHRVDDFIIIITVIC